MTRESPGPNKQTALASAREQKIASVKCAKSVFAGSWFTAPTTGALTRLYRAPSLPKRLREPIEDGG